MITVVGLGPGQMSRVPTSVRHLLLDPANTVVLRTMDHPASAELANERTVVSCDDLYETHESFDEVYEAIVERLGAIEGPVIYAVPGSPMVGEFAVRKLLERLTDVEVIPSESFVDAVLAEVGYDPLDRGLQIINGHHLPDPLVLDKPTIIGHVDRPEILGDTLDAVSRVTFEDQTVTVLVGLGAEDAIVSSRPIRDIALDLAGVRTSVFLDPIPSGLIGAVHVMRRLRAECPWDREQTHESLVKNLIEETYELVDALGALGSDDWVGYADVEDELGDVLLQVLFHAAIARESTAFDIDGVAGVLTEKLIRRHPHVFGDVTAETPDEVKQNWDQIKASEGGNVTRESILDGVPVSMPALQHAAKIQNRAAKIGFDWEEPAQVLPKVSEELDELARAIAGDGDVKTELGDLMFSVINLARHVGADPELALRTATRKFETRFRLMESAGPLDGLSLADLDQRWEQAKAAESTSG